MKSLEDRYFEIKILTGYIYRVIGCHYHQISPISHKRDGILYTRRIEYLGRLTDHRDTLYSIKLCECYELFVRKACSLGDTLP